MTKDSFNPIQKALTNLQDWKDSFGTQHIHSSLELPSGLSESILMDLSEKLKGNFPFHHANYAGQMLKPPHPLSWSAYALAMSINPNNHALDGGPPSSEMEKECISKLSELFGYGDHYLGHLSSSGTIANLEALWVARSIHPEKGIAFSSDAHYTHQRMAQVLGMNSTTVSLDQGWEYGLSELPIEDIGTIIVTMGTTGMGKVEPLSQVLDWAQSKGIRVHIDAAYGGFFKTIGHLLSDSSADWARMHEADSIVIDPHKHGLQPYGCGCVLFKDPHVGTFYKHDSPYTYFSSDELHLGEISLECSRAGASAAAFWATLQAFPLQAEKGFGPIMMACHRAARKAYEFLENSSNLSPIGVPELDIICYAPCSSTKATSTRDISRLSKALFNAGMKQPEPTNSYYLSLYTMKSSALAQYLPNITIDSDDVVVLRSVLMKPEQEYEIVELLSRVEADLIRLL